MPEVTYVGYDGKQHTVEVAIGASVMQGAVENLVDGIVAECGGTCSCATCHCYVDEAWVSRAGSADDAEMAMLDCVFDPLPNSRLACQILVTEQLDGLIVRLPENQT